MSPVWTPEKVVGARGFEPPTPWSRTRCSTRLSHAPTGAAQAPCNASSENSRLAQLAQLCQRRDALETLTREDGPCRKLPSGGESMRGCTSALSKASDDRAAPGWRAGQLRR